MRENNLLDFFKIFYQIHYFSGGLGGSKKIENRGNKICSITGKGGRSYDIGTYEQETFTPL